MPFDWGSVPAWSWAAIVMLAIVVVPLKLRVWKMLIERGKQSRQHDDEE